MIFKDITQLETEALKHKYNLSDAHTHQSQSKSQQEIVNSLPQLWMQSQNNRQCDSEQRFIKTFFRVHKQQTALSNSNTFLTYAASISIAIIASHLKNKRISVSLLHPCFDNIIDLLKYTEVSVHAIDENLFYDADKIYTNLQSNVITDAIFIIDPNNPTGFTLFSHGEKGWTELIRFAKDYNKLLIFDFCFTAFMFSSGSPVIFDRYKLLEEEGVSYITVEDTGKTWPLQDAKVSIIKTSDDLFEDIHNVHSSYLLNVSPFIINIVTEYILDSEKDHFKSVSALIQKNRAFAIQELDGTILQPIDPIAKVSVLWCRILAPEVNASELAKFFTQYNVHILPGTYFFWNDRVKGERYIRIALARDVDIFTQSMVFLGQLLKIYDMRFNKAQVAAN